MVEVAQEWFGFAPDPRLKVEISDGVSYIRKAAEDGKEERSSLTFHL